MAWLALVVQVVLHEALEKMYCNCSKNCILKYRSIGVSNPGELPYDLCLKHIYTIIQPICNMGQHSEHYYKTFRFEWLNLAKYLNTNK